VITIGIDPGITGALAILAPDGRVTCLDLPVMERASRRVRTKAGQMRDKITNQIDARALAQMLRDCYIGHDKNEILVLIEKCQAMPGTIKGSDKPQSSAGTFSLGLSAGLIEGVVAALGLPHQLVHPATWKAHFRVPVGKDAARAMASRWYPGAALDRVKDHGRAEAILIARYGQDKYS